MPTYYYIDNYGNQREARMDTGFRKVNSVEGERKGYNHGINEENRRDFFPQRYGVELEYESPTETNLNEIAELLTEEGLCWADVIRDGSLSHRGYEVISEPVDTLDELYEFMEGTLKVAQSLGSTNKSPTAIHIHVSNYDNPVELFYLMQNYGAVFEHLKQVNKNGLVHRFLSKPKLRNVKESIKHTRSYDQIGVIDMKRAMINKFDPVLYEKTLNVAQYFMDSRRSTIRYTGWDTRNRTIEFRILPQRMDKKIYKTYVKMVEKLLKYAEENSLTKIRQVPSRGIWGMMESFMNICGLSRTEMYRLFHRKTSPTLKRIRKDMPFYEVCNLRAPQTNISDILYPQKPSVEDLGAQSDPSMRTQTTMTDREWTTTTSHANEWMPGGLIAEPSDRGIAVNVDREAIERLRRTLGDIEGLLE